MSSPVSDSGSTLNPGGPHLEALNLVPSVKTPFQIRSRSWGQGLRCGHSGEHHSAHAGSHVLCKDGVGCVREKPLGGQRERGTGPQLESGLCHPTKARTSPRPAGGRWWVPLREHRSTQAGWTTEARGSPALDAGADSHRPGPRPASAHQDVAPTDDRAVAAVNHGHRLNAQGLSIPFSAPFVKSQNDKSRHEPPLYCKHRLGVLSPGITTWRVLLCWKIR